jgi:hypothetical protein
MASLIELHTLDGGVVEINPSAVVSLRAPQTKGVMHGSVRCIVNFVDGKFITVIESCATVRAKIIANGK